MSMRLPLCMAAGLLAHAAAAAQPVYETRLPGQLPLFSNVAVSEASRKVLEVLPPRAAGAGSTARGSAVLPAEVRRSVYDRMIEAAARKYNVHADLVRAVIAAESNFDPQARSAAGALGLMQVLPATARRFGSGDLLDPAVNIEVGAQYLAYLLRLFNGDLRLALAGYNAGEGAVIKHEYTVPPFPETQQYVPRVLSIWRELQRSRQGRRTHG